MNTPPRIMFAAILLSIVHLFSFEATAAQEIVVIVNAANGTDSMSIDDIRDFYLKSREVWADGARVRPVDRQGHPPERRTFISKVLGLSLEEVECHWITKKYGSALAPPTRAPNDNAVIRLVETFPGAIGFVSKEAFDAADNGNIKAVLTLSIGLDRSLTTTHVSPGQLFAPAFVHTHQ